MATTRAIINGYIHRWMDLLLLHIHRYTWRASDSARVSCIDDVVQALAHHRVANLIGHARRLPPPHRHGRLLCTAATRVAAS
jgi:hypothetical protein